MKEQRRQTLVSILAVLILLQLTGCASTNTSGDNQRQSPPSMGQNGRGGKQGPPPMNDRNSQTDNNREIDKISPAEAIKACVDKNSGDLVELIDPTGKTIRATCRENDDHLVAVPDQKRH